MSEELPTPPVEKKGPKGLGFALDFGPLLLFFLANYLAPKYYGDEKGALIAIGVLVVSLAVAIIISKIKLGKVGPMMWVSGILGIGFGGIAILLGDKYYIQIKPTIVYMLFTAILLGGLFRGKALLKYLLEHAFQGVSETGWKKLSRNWAVFFLAMAGLNELIRQVFDYNTWVAVKVWGVMALTFIFTMLQIPMLTRHGLKLVDKEAEAPQDK